MNEREKWKQIGKELQRVRKDAGFKSANSFAEFIGMKTSAYTEYDQGRRMFNYEQAWMFADALGCSMDDLVGRKWPPDGAGTLGSDESQLISAYRECTPREKKSILDMTETMADDGRAKSDSDAGSGAA